MGMLRNGEYIGQVLLPSEYTQWKPGDKILISGSPNTGKTRFAIDYATYMYREHKLISLFITSRGLVRRQLENEYAHSVHSFMKIKTYHNYLDPGKMVKLESYDIIIVDESAVFFDDVFIPGLGDKADLVLNNLIDNCQKSIVIFMSALGNWLSSYIHAYYNSNNGIYNPVRAIQDLLATPAKLTVYNFTKHLNYADRFMLGDNDIDDLLNSIPEEDKVIYFCSENESGKVHKRICNQEYERIISASEAQEQRITAAKSREVRKYVKDSIALLNADEFNKYKEPLSKSRHPGRYHKAFEEVILSKKLNAKILVASVNMASDISIIDPCIKHVIIDVYNQSQVYRMAGRLKSASDKAKIYFRIRNYNYSHIRLLLKRREIINQLMSGNVPVSNFNIEDLQGLVKMEDAIKPIPHNDYANTGYIRQVLLKPILVAHHKVELDINSYFMAKDRSADDLFYKYDMVDKQIPISKYMPASHQTSIDWLRATLTKFAQDGTVLFDEDMQRQIIEHTAIASGRKRRKRRGEITKDLDFLGIRIEITDKRERWKDENGNYIKNDKTGNHIFRRGWQFNLCTDDA